MRTVTMIEMSTRDRAIIAEAVFGLRAVYRDEQHDTFVRPVKALSSDWPAGKFGDADEYKGGNPVSLGNLMFCRDVLNDALPKLDAQSDPEWWKRALNAQEDKPGLPTTMQPSFMAQTLADARRTFAASVQSALAVMNRAIGMATWNNADSDMTENGLAFYPCVDGAYDEDDVTTDPDKAIFLGIENKLANPDVPVTILIDTREDGPCG